MIPKTAVAGFLAGPRDDHRWLKKISSKDLWDVISGLDPKPDLWPHLHKHQLVCFYLGVAYPRFSFWLDLGLGKSLLTLELLRYWWRCGRLRRAVVFVTSDKAYLTWTRQIEQYGIDLPFVFLDGSSADKWRQLDCFAEGLVIVHYPGAVAMCSHLVETKRGASKWELSSKMVNRFARAVDAVVFDESTRLGNRGSLTSQLGCMLAAKAAIVYNLAGRPFGRDPTLVWHQQKLVDGGETFGPTLGLFRAAFCSEEDKPYSRSKYAREYKFKKQMMPQFTRLMQHRSITYAEHECLDLPRYQSIIKEVVLPTEAEAYYRRLVADMKAAVGSFREIKNAFVRMRQLSSGFIGFVDDDTGQRAQIEFGTNPKLEAQLDLIEELPAGCKMVVFYEFTWSGRKLVEALRKRGTRCIWLWSGTKDSRADLLRFLDQNSGYEVAVINNRVGAYSLDGLQDVANYVSFYESPVACIDREQAEKRVRRQGQKHCVFQYDLVTRGTKDQLILDFHREGRDLFKAFRQDTNILIR